MRDTGEVSVFREEAADEAVGVFIAAAFRGAVRMGRVMNGSRVTGYAGSANREGSRELAAIIRGDG